MKVDPVGLGRRPKGLLCELERLFRSAVAHLAVRRNDPPPEPAFELDTS